jgi:hypothetical protein
MGPLTVLVLAMPLLVLGHLAELAVTSPRRAAHRAGTVAIAVGVLGLVWTAGLVVAPLGWFTRFFGEAWESALPLVLAIGCYHSLSGASASLQSGLRALLLPAQAMRVRMLTSPLLIAVPVGVSLVGSPLAAVWSLAAVELLSVAMLYYRLRSVGRGASADRPADPSGSADFAADDRAHEI